MFPVAHIGGGSFPSNYAVAYHQARTGRGPANAEAKLDTARVYVTKLACVVYAGKLLDLETE